MTIRNFMKTFQGKYNFFIRIIPANKIYGSTVSNHKDYYSLKSFSDCVDWKTEIKKFDFINDNEIRFYVSNKDFEKMKESP